MTPHPPINHDTWCTPTSETHFMTHPPSYQTQEKPILLRLATIQPPLKQT